MEFIISKAPIKITPPVDAEAWTAKNYKSNQDNLSKIESDFKRSFNIEVVQVFDKKKHLRINDLKTNYHKKLGEGHNDFFKLHYNELFEKHKIEVEEFVSVIAYINNSENLRSKIRRDRIVFNHTKDFTKSCVVMFSDFTWQLKLYVQQLDYKKEK